MSGVETLRGTALCAGLMDDELQTMAALLGKRTFGRGVYIFHKGSPGHVMYLIESGRVRIFAVSDMGREISIDVYGPGDLFGEMAVLDGQARSAGAVCLERTVVLTARGEDLEVLLVACPRLARNLLRILSNRLRHTSRYAQDLAFLDVTGRVARRLLDLVDSCGVQGDGAEIDLYLTQAELASWVAASRESVNKALNAFRAQGLLRLQEGEITVLDRRKLEGQIRY
jgi:CRP/FNR family transcriptional regulator/CRP/FNR family cyclic AMP-dependent transcriptional regulator